MLTASVSTDSVLKDIWFVTTLFCQIAAIMRKADVQHANTMEILALSVDCSMTIW